MDQNNFNMPQNSVDAGISKRRMPYLKYIFSILGILALLVAIIAGIYAILFFNGKTKASKELAKAYESTISIPSDACNFPPNAVARYFSATIRTPDVVKVRRDIMNLAEKYKAAVTTSSASTGRVIGEFDPYYYPGYGSISLYVSPNESEAFIKDVRKIVTSPNQLSDEYTTANTVDTLMQWSDEAIQALQGLQSKEKIYLEQLANRKEGTDIAALTQSLEDTRSDARYYISYIRDLTGNNINKFGVSITIEEVPAG